MRFIIEPLRKVQKRLVAEFLRRLGLESSAASAARHKISKLVSLRLLKHLNWLQPQQVRPRDPEKAW